MKIGRGVSELWGVENRPLLLTWPMAYTTACTTVQAVITSQQKDHFCSSSKVKKMCHLNESGSELSVKWLGVKTAYDINGQKLPSAPVSLMFPLLSYGTTYPLNYEFCPAQYKLLRKDKRNTCLLAAISACEDFLFCAIQMYSLLLLYCFGCSPVKVLLSSGGCCLAGTRQAGSIQHLITIVISLHHQEEVHHWENCHLRKMLLIIFIMIVIIVTISMRMNTHFSVVYL